MPTDLQPTRIMAEKLNGQVPGWSKFDIDPSNGLLKSYKIESRNAVFKEDEREALKEMTSTSISIAKAVSIMAGVPKQMMVWLYNTVNKEENHMMTIFSEYFNLKEHLYNWFENTEMHR